MLIALLIGIATPISAQPRSPFIDSATSDLAREQRVARIGYRLAVAARALCDRPQAITGLVLHDAAGYSERDRPAIAKAYRFGMGFGVRFVVPESAAWRAGLRTGDVLVRVGDTALEAYRTDLIGKRASPERTDRTIALIADRLAAGPLPLILSREGIDQMVQMGADRGCGGIAVVADDNTMNAWSDGHGTAITGRLVDRLDDDELAFVLAHEMAHNILNHAALMRRGSGLLRELGIGTGALKESELAADEMGARITISAQFKGDGAVSFLDKIARIRGVTLPTTHPGFKLRIERVRLVLTSLAATAGARASDR